MNPLINLKNYNLFIIFFRTDADGITTIVSYDWFVWLTDSSTGKHFAHLSDLLQSSTSTTLKVPNVTPNGNQVVYNYIGVALRYIDGKGVASIAYSDDAVDCTSANAVTWIVKMNGKLYVSGTGVVGSKVSVLSTISTSDPTVNQLNGTDSGGHLNVAYWFYLDGVSVLQSGAPSSYTIQPSDEGHTITCKAAYLDQYGLLEFIDGDKTIGPITTAPAAPGNNLPTGNVSVTGSSSVGGKLTITTNTIADADGLGTFSYQWKSGTTNVGTNVNNYSVLLSDVGKVITCVVSYTDGKGNAESVTSNPLGPVNLMSLELTSTDNGINSTSNVNTSLPPGEVAKHTYFLELKLNGFTQTLSTLLPTLTNVKYRFQLDRTPWWYNFNYWENSYNYQNAELDIGTVVTGTVTAKDASGATVTLTGTSNSNVITIS